MTSISRGPLQIPTSNSTQKSGGLTEGGAKHPTSKLLDQATKLNDKQKDSFSLSNAQKDVTDNINESAPKKIVNDGDNTVNTSKDNKNQEIDINGGTKGNNNVTTGNGHNKVRTFAEAGSNTVKTGKGDDTINASGNKNDINAGDGNDQVSVKGKENSVTTGAGNDTIQVQKDFLTHKSDNKYTLNGGDGKDSLDLYGRQSKWTVTTDKNTGITTYTHKRTGDVVTANDIEKVNFNPLSKQQRADALQSDAKDRADAAVAAREKADASAATDAQAKHNLDAAKQTQAETGTTAQDKANAAKAAQAQADASKQAADDAKAKGEWKPDT